MAKERKVYGEVLTVADAAVALKVSSQTIRQLIQAGFLSGFKVRHSWRIHKQSLDTFISRRTEESQ